MSRAALFLPLLFCSCLKTDPDLNAHVYTSGVHSLGGGYNQTQCAFEATVRVSVADRNGYPLNSRETFLKGPKGVTITPERCTTTTFQDEEGICLFQVRGNRELEGLVEGYVETGNVADSTTGASKKSHKTFVRIASKTQLFFSLSTQVRTLEPSPEGWTAEIQLADHQGPLPHTKVTVAGTPLAQPFSTTTDESGLLVIPFTSTGSPPWLLTLSLPGITPPHPFQLDP